jgi:hypothetical protein
MLAILSDPKFLVAIITVACQLLGQYGVHEDPTAVTTVLSPLYLWILAHAHAQNGAPPPSPVATTAPKQSGFVRWPVMFAIALGGAALCFALASCSATAKQTEKAAAVCTVDDAAKIVAILERTDLNSAQKLEQLGVQVGPDVVACVTAQAKAAASSGSGSAK